MKAERSLTIFVPALNEEGHLEASVNVVARAARDARIDYEVIVVDDGSTDRTPAIADRLAAADPAAKVIHHPACLGLGTAYRSAVEQASKAHFVFIPGDNSWPLESVSGLFGRLGEADVVISYPLNAKEQRVGIRRFISTGYTSVLNLLHGQRLRYYNGLTIYPTAFLRANPVQASGFGFAAELLLAAIYDGMTVLEVGLAIQERTGGASKAVSLRNIGSVLLSLWRGFWRLRLGMGRRAGGALSRDG
ncbi:MAG: glycosyltransferase family 2 protein [Burkholderiales bacterium]